jgi:hypothetical protein
LHVSIRSTTDAHLETVALLSNLDKVTSCTAYRQVVYDMTRFRGQTIRIDFFGTTSSNAPTTFRIDDVSLVVR